MALFPAGSQFLVVYPRVGPLLFVIYINDISSIVSSHLFKFADDAKLYRSILNPSDIQLDTLSLVIQLATELQHIQVQSNACWLVDAI